MRERVINIIQKIKNIKVPKKIFYGALMVCSILLIASASDNSSKQLSASAYPVQNKTDTIFYSVPLENQNIINNEIKVKSPVKNNNRDKQKQTNNEKKLAESWAYRKNLIYQSPSGQVYHLLLPSNQRCDKEKSLDFLVQNLEIMAQEKQRTNIPISLKLFQAWWESNFGNTKLGKQGNFYGIKKGKVAEKYASGTDRMKDDHAHKSTFWTFSRANSLKAHSDVVKSITGEISKNNPYIGDWTYKVYLWEMQCVATICKSCKGYGCKKCRGDGLDGKVYATGKSASTKANPKHYLKVGLEQIEKYEWHIIDKIYEKEGMSGVSKLISWMKTRKQYL